MSDWQLLREYVEKASESALLELTRRYVDLVFSTALRKLENPQAASEATKSVFLLLLTKAPYLQRQNSLAGWLYQSVGFQTLKYWRPRDHFVSPRSLPTVTWRQIAPVLDEAMDKLIDTDRSIVLLSLFLNKTSIELTQILEIREDVVQLRVCKATNKLCDLLRRYGIDCSRDQLQQLLAENAVHAAPESLARDIYHQAIQSQNTAPNVVTATRLFSNLRFRMVAGLTLIMLITFASLEVIRRQPFASQHKPVSLEKMPAFLIHQQLANNLPPSTRLPSPDASPSPNPVESTIASNPGFSLQIYLEAKLVEVAAPIIPDLSSVLDNPLLVEITEEMVPANNSSEDEVASIEQSEAYTDSILSSLSSQTDSKFDPDSLGLPPSGKSKSLTTTQHKLLLAALEQDITVKVRTIFSAVTTNGFSAYLTVNETSSSHSSTSIANNSASLSLRRLEPVWTAVPTLMADGRTIHLNVSQFENASREINGPFNSTGGMFPQTAFPNEFDEELANPESHQVWRIMAWDGQTVVINCGISDSDFLQHRFLFITPRIVDFVVQHNETAGN